MTDNTQGDLLFIHTDLEGSDQSINTNRFCVPIYITNSFGINLAKEADLVSVEGQRPKVRSGTLTFVRHDDQIYGITCRHVVEALEEAEAEIRNEWQAHPQLRNATPPPGGHRRFTFPAPNEQVHINAQFHKAHLDAFTGRGKDLAIARIPSDTFAKIKREAIPGDRVGLPPTPHSPSLCGIATGFPEQSRKQRPASTVGAVLSMPTVIAFAPFEEISESTLWIHSEIKQLPEANNLSGMSGGPILWSDETGWGLTGIVKEGMDTHPALPLDGVTPIFERPKVWVEGEPLTPSLLEELIATIPDDDPDIPYWVSTAIPIKQWRQ
ncbi:hypothetical protein G3N95_14785 [Paraburkholderia sp. Tr-20389]|uniref:hypothetical protein n=1 Tax=Paraburkholderia sp. Tr-20389 TaxID=2703903 RepID=UPI00197FDB20|nr:hypothetical protein [Paraburkholderia sp. Tr-20389]MBN3754215.1 hypothetical protein [Paraburkholderia sp. Tr-20389]